MSLDLIDAILAKVQCGEIVHRLIAEKVNSALDKKKAEITASLLKNEKLPHNHPDRKKNLSNFTKYSRAKGVFYHATNSPEDFDAFDTGRSDLGSHFGNLDQANKIAMGMRLNNSEGTRIIPVRLSIRNPLRLKDVGSFHADGIASQLERKRLLPKGEGKQIEKEIDSDWRLRKKHDPILRDIIQKAGYDGIVYKNEHEGVGDSYIAFHPHQIKSAIGNNGQYDASKQNYTESVLPYNDPQRKQNLNRFTKNADPQVVHDNGTPKTFYHGIRQNIDSFNPKKSFGGLGVSWVSPSPHFASSSDYTSGTGGNVMPVHVGVKNIFDFSNPEHLEKLRDKAKNIKIYDAFRGFTTLDTKVPTNNNGNFFNAEHPDIFRLIKSMGHDGVAVHENGVKNIGVFDGKKIKSAIGNSGQYDTTKKSITETSYSEYPKYSVWWHGSASGDLRGGHYGPSFRNKESGRTSITCDYWASCRRFVGWYS